MTRQKRSGDNARAQEQYDQAIDYLKGVVLNNALGEAIDAAARSTAEHDTEETSTVAYSRAADRIFGICEQIQLEEHLQERSRGRNKDTNI